MSEVEKRGGPAFDRTVGASGGAALGVLAALYLGPEVGNVLGAATGPLVEELSYSMRQLAQRRFMRVQLAAEEASREAGSEFADLARRSLDDDGRATLLSAALQAAADAADEQKVRALGRAYARGAIASDDAVVDEQFRIVTTLAALEPVDVRVLHRMSSNERWSVKPMDDNPYYPALTREEPGVASIVYAVVARLSNLGLISNEAPGGLSWNGSGGNWHVTDFGRLCLRSLLDVGNDNGDDSGDNPSWPCSPDGSASVCTGEPPSPRLGWRPQSLQFGDRHISKVARLA